MPRRKGDCFTYFTFVLYPQEDDRHRRILDHIKSNRIQFPDYLCITHDEDEVEEEERDTLTSGLGEHEVPCYKKSHVHVLVKYCMQKSQESFLRQFGGALSKVIGITDYIDQCLYFTHENLSAILEHKHIYPKERLQGTAFLLRKCDIVQNSNFVQFFNVVKGISQTAHCTLVEYMCELEKLPDDERNYMLSIVHSYMHVLKNTTIEIRNIKNGYFTNIKEIEEYRNDQN